MKYNLLVPDFERIIKTLVAPASINPPKIPEITITRTPSMLLKIWALLMNKKIEQVLLQCIEHLCFHIES
jgi:hypothetical protein